MIAIVKRTITKARPLIKQYRLSALVAFSGVLFLIYQLNAKVYCDDDATLLRLLTHYNSNSPEGKHNQFKMFVLAHLMNETYLGTWESNQAYPNFTNRKGVMQIIFKVFKRTRLQDTFYYDYDLVLLDGEDNNQSLIITNSYFFSFTENKPVIEYNNESNVVLVNDELRSSLSHYRYLALVSQVVNDTNTTLVYSSNQTGKNLNRELNGTISLNDFAFVFNTKQNRPSFYQEVTSFCCGLVFLSIVQVFFFQCQLKLFNDYPDEALKYSPYTFIANCLYNGSIGFECFLAAMLNEKLFYTFILPSILYFINFSFVELKLILLTMKIHERYDSSQRLMSIKARLVHFCILFYFLLICLFIYSFDLFFWKSVSFCFVVMTFVPQMLYGIKKSQHASIVYLVLISLNKLYIPVYFRSEGNFLHFKKDLFFILSIIIVLYAEILIILFQRFLWRNSYSRAIRANERLERNKKRNKNSRLYKTIDELKEKNIDINNMKCSICLGELNAAYQLKASANASMITIEDNTVSTSDKAGDKDKSKEIVSVRQSCCMRTFKCFMVKGKKEEPIKVMMTPCKHIFHIECLEEWLKIKYSCPQCRFYFPQVS